MVVSDNYTAKIYGPSLNLQERRSGWWIQVVVQEEGIMDRSTYVHIVCIISP